MTKVAVLGATGLVGREMLATLERRRVPVSGLRLLASSRSAGQTIDWRGQNYTVEDVDQADVGGIEAALFSAGAGTARHYAARFVQAGAVVIDNSSAYRSEPLVPLVVPEVNAAAVTAHRGIIANPNCSTIQLVVALKPLMDAVGLTRVHVATYQSVSGQGWKGVAALDDEVRGELAATGDGAAASGDGSIFPHPIAFEALPHCGDFDDDGWSLEEVKLMRESQRILGNAKLLISATAVRVPVKYAHSEAVWVETRKPIGVDEAREILREAPGIELVDDPATAAYPLARRAAGSDPVYVGRLRRDPTVDNGLLFWVVADNVRKGAALNAVQILEELLMRRMIHRIKEPHRS